MDANTLAHDHMQWRLAAYGRVIRGDENTSEDQVAAATYSDADARRLVACWNACEGLPTDRLESESIENTLSCNTGEIAELRAQLSAALLPPDADDVEWIVNDIGELGVRVRGRCYFCYKGGSLVYKDGIHDSGEPILHRNVGKCEFGETVWPYKWNIAGVREDRYTQELTYTPGLSDGPPDNQKYKWLPLPVIDDGGAQ